MPLFILYIYMRKTPGHNPRGFERNSWGYRVLQIRHALGWSQERLAEVMDVLYETIWKIENGLTLRPSIPTIRAIREIEAVYEDIIKEYKKAPVRMDRLRGQSYNRVGLQPIEVRRPEDLESLGKVEADSEPLFFGRKTRQRMQQTGMSLQRKAFLARRREKIQRGVTAKIATGWSANGARRKVQSGQPDGEGGGEGGLDS